MATPVLLHILGIGGLLHCATSMATPALLHVLGTGGLPYNHGTERELYIRRNIELYGANFLCLFSGRNLNSSCCVPYHESLQDELEYRTR